MFPKEAKRKFHAILFGVVEPLLQKVPPIFLLLAQEMIPPPSPAQITLVSSETTLVVGSISGVKKTVIFDELIMKTLEHLGDENYEPKERLVTR